MGFSDGFIPFAVPSEGVFDYTLVSDGTTVTGYNNLGQAVASGTDGGAVFTTVLAQIPATGGALGFRNDGNIFPWASVPALPRSITNRLLITGDGATVQLSTNGRRFLDFNKVADGDTFQNLWITDFVIDANNVGGKHHVILGTFVNGVTTARINLDRIVLQNIKAINVYTDPAGVATNARYGVWLTVGDVLGQGTQYTISNVLCENVRVEGGVVGCVVAGQAQGGSGSLNVYQSNIELLRCYHDTTFAGNYASNNFQIGGSGFGRDWRIINCQGFNCGDAGIEVDAGQNITVQNCSVWNSYNSNYLHANFRAPDYPDTQLVRWIECDARVTTAFTGNSHGIQIASTGGVNVGNHLIRGFTYTRDYTASLTGIYTGAAVYRRDNADVSGSPSSQLSIDTLVCEHINFNHSGASNLSMYGLWLDTRATTTTNLHLRLRDVTVTFNGTRTSTGALSMYACNLQGGVLGLDVDGLFATFALTSSTNGAAHMIQLAGTAATTIIYGRLRRITPLSVLTDTTPFGLRIWGSNLTINKPPVVLTDCDFSAYPAGATEIKHASGSLQTSFSAYRTKWATWPKLPAAMSATTFAAATFTSGVGNQYIGGYPALIQMTGGTLVTAIDVSLDNATYYNIDTQAAGVLANTLVFYVDNGTYVKVTFAAGTQPATVVIPLK